MSNARRDKTEEWDMRPRPEPDYTALVQELEHWKNDLDPFGLRRKSLAAIRDLQERLAIEIGKRASVEKQNAHLVRISAEEWQDMRRQRDEAVEVLRAVLPALVAAHSLLERGGRKAAPSDTMFLMMLQDYANSIERGRAFLSTLEPKP